MSDVEAEAIWQQVKAARAARPRRPAAVLAPIVKTGFARRITRGGNGLTERRECWGAQTTDGIWEFEREDSPGTPWLVYHRPSVADGSYVLPVTLCGTLRSCRMLAASGALDRELATRKAVTVQPRTEAVTGY